LCTIAKLSTITCIFTDDEQKRELNKNLKDWIQRCSRKAQALVRLKPVNPPFYFKNMLKSFVGREPEPSAPCRALQSLCCPKSCSKAAAERSYRGNISSGFLTRMTEKLKIKVRVCPRFYTKPCVHQGEEFGELSYCCLNTYSEQNSFPHAPGLQECHTCACKGDLHG